MILTDSLYYGSPRTPRPRRKSFTTGRKGRGGRQAIRSLATGSARFSLRSQHLCFQAKDTKTKPRPCLDTNLDDANHFRCYLPLLALSWRSCCGRETMLPPDRWPTLILRVLRVLRDPSYRLPSRTPRPWRPVVKSSSASEVGGNLARETTQAVARTGEARREETELHSFLSPALLASFAKRAISLLSSAPMSSGVPSHGSMPALLMR
jgi:hypothetical protein